MTSAATPEWRGQPFGLARLVRWVLLSLALHLPLTPLAGLLGLALLMAPRDEEPLDVPPITEIPIELLPQWDVPAPAPASAEASTDSAAVALPAEPPPKKPPPRVLEDAGAPPPDAGADAGADGGVDAGSPDAGTPDAGSTMDAGAADAGSDAGVERRPLAVTGGRGVVDPNANVKLLIDSQRLRTHALGTRLGKLLGSVYQWRDFFGPTGIDPIRDTDRIFITGPQLRDSRAVVAIIQHRVDPARLRAAVDILVQRDPNGEWLEGPMPVAKARADRGERYFVMPSARLLVVTPESALNSARRLTARFSLPAMPAPEVLTAQVETPWRVFIGTGLSIPKTLKWADVRVSPEPDGGAVVRFLAEDEDEATAERSAAQIERAIDDGLGLLANATNIFALLFGGNSPKLAQSIKFHAEGKRVVGVLTFTESQVIRILDLASRLLLPPSARAPSTASGAARPNAAPRAEPPGTPTRAPQPSRAPAQR